ncbi:MAG: ABC transporter permease [Armatimonadetes bacterium]|nr:ABC transporter permease [Armatimonadota bacterium]
MAKAISTQPPPFYVLRRVFQPRELLILGVFLLELAIFWRLKPESVSLTSLSQDADYISLYGIAGVGAALVIISGGIDLSSGRVLGLCAVVMGLLATQSRWPLPAWVCALLTVGVGLLAGLLNGVAIAYLGVPPFIVTLGSMSAAGGLAYLLTGGMPLSFQEFRPDVVRFVDALSVRLFEFDAFPGLRTGIFVMLGLALLAAFWLHVTPWGRYVLSIGGSEEASRHAGVPVAQVKVLVYMVAGGLAGLAGIFYVTNFGGPNSGVGAGWELNIIAAVVVGGVSLSGGRGSPLGVVIGAMLIEVLRSGLQHMEVEEGGAKIAIGLFIILAVVIERGFRALGARLAGRVRPPAPLQ